MGRRGKKGLSILAVLASQSAGLFPPSLPAPPAERGSARPPAASPHFRAPAVVMAAALVIDNGGWKCRAGSVEATGEDGGDSGALRPACTVPNCCAKLKGQLQTLVAEDIEEVKRTQLLIFSRPIERGFVVDWGVQHDVWRRVISKFPKAEVLVLTEAALAPAPLQANALEMAFVDFGFSAVVKAPAPSFAAYRRATESPESGPCCLVVESGFSFTHAVPFCRGRSVRGAIRRVNVGGKLLTNYMKELVSYRQYNMMDEFMLLNALKEQLCFVADDFKAALARTGRSGDGSLRRDFVLPDFQQRMEGYVLGPDEPLEEGAQALRVENERFTVPEVLFHPSDVGVRQGGAVEAAHAAVQACPLPLREQLYGNVLLIGGNCKIPGFRERFERELRALAPDDMPVHVAVPQDPENYAWGGAAMVARARAWEPRGGQAAAFAAAWKADFDEGGAAACAELLDAW